MARPHRRRLGTLLLAALTVLLDQVSKAWALDHLAGGSIYGADGAVRGAAGECRAHGLGHVQGRDRDD